MHFRSINQTFGRSPARLAIAARLARGPATPQELVVEIGGTITNVNEALRALSGAGYVTLTAAIVSSRAKRTAELTDTGRRALAEHQRAVGALTGCDGARPIP
jgi:DNA-binding transcriptional ArsR family regulator